MQGTISNEDSSIPFQAAMLRSQNTLAEGDLTCCAAHRERRYLCIAYSDPIPNQRPAAFWSQHELLHNVRRCRAACPTAAARFPCVQWRYQQ